MMSYTSPRRYAPYHATKVVHALPLVSFVYIYVFPRMAQPWPSYLNIYYLASLDMPKPGWKNICPYRHTVSLPLLPLLKWIPVPDYCKPKENVNVKN
jgi:hypothetical protein